MKRIQAQVFSRELPMLVTSFISNITSKSMLVGLHNKWDLAKLAPNQY